MALTATPALAGNGSDPWVAEEGFNRTGTQGDYHYEFIWHVCNQGSADYTEDGWDIAWAPWNGNSASPVVSANGRRIGLQNGNLLAGCTNHIYNNGYPNPTVINDTAFYCCGMVQFAAASTSMDDNLNNNQRTVNDHTLVMHAGQTRRLMIAILNFGAATGDDVDPPAITFDNAIVGLSNPWEFEVEEYSTEVEAGKVGYFNISITAPSSIFSWPEFDVISEGQTRSMFDQHTHVRVGNDANEEDACGGQAISI